MNEEVVAPKPEVEELLPDGYEYVIRETKSVHDGFAIVCRVNLKSEEEILKWLEAYQQRNGITLSEDDYYKKNSTKNVYKKQYKCVQCTPPVNGSPSRECGSIIKTTLKYADLKRFREDSVQTHPCEIFILHSHNHALSTSNSLHFEDLFKVLFEEGHSPTSALIKIKEELLQQYGENYLKIVPRGKICLCESWVNLHYLSLYNAPYKEEDPDDYEEPYEEFLQKESSELEKIINEYNDKCGDVCALVNEQLTIAICSPFMKRNWVMINEVEEVIYVDSFDLEKHDMRIMLFLCPSHLGVLPLGILLFPCGYDDEEFIRDGIELLQTILPEGAQTPDVMIVADTNEKKCNLLKDSFNIENVIICKNYIQKAALKWLWNHKNHISKAERIKIYVIFIKTLNSETEEEFQDNYENLQRLTFVLKNKNVFNYFEELKATALLWATCYTENEEYDSYEYSKIMFRVLDKNYLGKTLKTVQLFAYIASRFENYFFNRLTKIMNCDGLKSELAENWPGCSSSVFDCRDIGYNLYSVVEETKIHIVNSSIDCCTCNVNQKEAPCQHKWAVKRAYNIDENEYPLATEELKQLIKRLLVDDQCILKGWYDENISNEVVEPHLEEIRSKLEETMETIMQRLITNPKQFIKPIEKFIKDFGKCKTDTDLANALENFGEPSRFGTTVAATSNGVKIKQEKDLAPVGDVQNSPGNLVRKTYSNLVKENGLNSINRIKKRKISDS